jgi:hypothetical protein
MKELRTLLERSVNGQSIDMIVDVGNMLADDANNDEDFTEWFGRVDSYTHKVRVLFYIICFY